MPSHLDYDPNRRLALEVGASPHLRAALEMVALRVVREARKRAPVDTGRLRNSIGHQVTAEGGKVVATIGTNVSYAPFQEYGTRTGVPAKRFLGGALLFVAEQLRARAR